MNKNLKAEFGTKQTEYCGKYYIKNRFSKTYGYGTYYHPVFRKQLAILSVSWRMLLYIGYLSSSVSVCPRTFLWRTLLSLLICLLLWLRSVFSKCNSSDNVFSFSLIFLASLSFHFAISVSRFFFLTPLLVSFSIPLSCCISYFLVRLPVCEKNQLSVILCLPVCLSVHC